MAVTWTVVIPVKVLAQAKSRLGVLAGPRRPELAMAMAMDTASAVLGCPDVARVLVVTSDAIVTGQLSSLGAIVVPTVDSRGADVVSAGEAILDGRLNAALAPERSSPLPSGREPGSPRCRPTSRHCGRAS